MKRGTILLLLLAVAWTPLQAQKLSELFKRVSPSVVVIETTQKEIAPHGAAQPVTVGGLGSGVLISNDGKVMTAAHVVQTAESIEVAFLSGEKIPARVLSSEPAADVALLQLERMPQVSRIATLGDSDSVEVGDEIFVVGAPFGISHSLTVGHVSGRRLPDSKMTGMGLAEFFQTDAAINQGNSGGPMFNMDGEVIAIVSHIVTMSGGSEGLGFAVTANVAQRLLLQRRSFWSGMDGFLIRGELARLLNLPQPAGVLAQRVAAGSLAAHLGLKPGTVPAQIGDQQIILGGDVVLEVMGIPIEEEVAQNTRIRERLNELKENEKIVLKVLRGGQVVELSNFYFPDLLVPKPVSQGQAP